MKKKVPGILVLNAVHLIVHSVITRLKHWPIWLCCSKSIKKSSVIKNKRNNQFITSQSVELKWRTQRSPGLLILSNVSIISNPEPNNSMNLIIPLWLRNCPLKFLNRASDSIHQFDFDVYLKTRKCSLKS